MHCVAGDGDPRRRCARARFWPHRPARGLSRIRPWFCVRLDGVPGVVHARHVRRLLPPLDRPHLHPGTAVYELADGRHGAHDDDPADAARERRRSDNSGVLVRHVDGTAGRLHRHLSDELVAGTLQSEARHDDGAPRRRTRAQRSHRTRRYGRDAARDGGDGPRGETTAHCPCHDPIVVCRPCGRPGDRLDRRTDERQIQIRDRIGAAPTLHQIRRLYCRADPAGGGSLHGHGVRLVEPRGRRAAFHTVTGCAQRHNHGGGLRPDCSAAARPVLDPQCRGTR